MDKKQEEMYAILKKELAPALGCTGPTAVSYVAAEAATAVGGKPLKVEVKVDRHIGTKNSDVGIPGTSSVGLKIAAALGAIAGDAQAGLNVLHKVTKEDEAVAQAFSKSGNVSVIPDLETDILGLYMDCVVTTDKGIGRAIVLKTHTNLVYREANGIKQVDIPFDRIASMNETKDAMAHYEIADFYAFATQTPIEKLEFLKEAVQLNKALADACFMGEAKGAGFGISMLKHAGEDMVKKAKAMTAAGAETRMIGYPLPAMSCATSGNVGITASLPLVSMAEDLKCKEEQLLRALAMSFLMTICVKNRIGRVSSMCACVTAASQGIAAGATMLLGGDLACINKAINNTIVNIFGVVCDGARLACALKLASAAGIAIECSILAVEGVETPLNEGVVGGNADMSLNFMGKFAQTGMAESDLALCKALYEKQQAQG
ncbi:serine dehydratase alpha chain [Anaerotignum neopropionicum]|uniref:Serine dehydratase alpha chain n=1 Tax=Anaerotignum neopropionicum TaxID=36847 RepID=A0A136WI47_9FIRM|nr:L-serine ammonia-lyase, iron-sulfur-dependent, subunit alpha [Anaerotignum neopropionicum]KXL54215.1 serine dehydratase alpha chain [Anaerotignum neopropionicum]KXL54340.1 serine dehydratase alpha chain [Anaerotignum neopropionicum]